MYIPITLILTSCSSSVGQPADLLAMFELEGPHLSTRKLNLSVQQV